MARIGLLDRIHGECANGVDAELVKLLLSFWRRSYRSHFCSACSWLR